VLGPNPSEAKPMSKRWWGALPALLLLRSCWRLVVARAQDTTVQNDDLGLVAELHQGSCASFTADVAFSIGDLTRSGSNTDTSDSNGDDTSDFADLGTGLVGAANTAPVWTASDTVDSGPADLFDQTQPYAVVVGESGPNGAVAACGDLGGVVNNGEIAVALLPVNATQNGTLAGVAVFDSAESEASLDESSTVLAGDATDIATAESGTSSDQTDVSVYVFQLTPAASATGTATATTPAATVEVTGTIEPSATVEPAASPTA